MEQSDNKTKSPEVKKNNAKNAHKTEEKKIANEVSKQLYRVGKPPTKRNSLRANPLIILVTGLLIVFLIFGFFNNPISQNANAISLTELFNGLEQNEYSQLVIQDNGKVQARDKTIVLSQINTESNETIDIEVPEGTNLIQEGEMLQEVSIDEFVSEISVPSLLDQIRSAFGSDQRSTIHTIIEVENDYILGLTGNETPNYFISDASLDLLKLTLEEEGISLSSNNVETFSTRVFAEIITDESLKTRVENSQLDTVIQLGEYVIGQKKDSVINVSEVDWTPNIFTFTEILQNEGVSLDQDNFEIVSSTVPGGITLDTILTVLTIVGFIFLGVIIFRSAQASGMGLMQFGQSKAKMFFGQKTETTFKDVAGIDEAKEELHEIVDFLKNPSKYLKMGARIPKGIIMFGAPGTGKTLLARAIAGEAGVPFFHTSGSEFEEMLVGAGASRVRDLFAKAKRAAPALIFIDEIDAVARKRGTRIQSGSTEQTLNQILVEMDGFEKNTNVIVIAATNRPDVLDRAILRPGRFDRQVRIELPDKDGRLDILKIHARNKKFAKNVNLERVAGRTVGFSGADLENILNEAAIIAAKANQTEITNADIDEAVSKIILGPAKRSRKRTKEELDLVAYHEAGHALVSKYTEGAVPVDKISIVSRGSAGGVTMFLPEKDESIVSMKRLLADIRVSLGGRAAEEVVLGDISTGASNDIEKATRVARNMIQKYGMSKDLGLVQYGQSMDNAYLGYAYGDNKDFSEKSAELIDDEIRKIIQEAYADALQIVQTHRNKLDEIAHLLLDKEVVDKEEFNKLFE